MRPIKTIHDKRLAYLKSLSQVYEEEGYVTVLNGWDNILEIYPTTFVKEQEHAA